MAPSKPETNTTMNKQEINETLHAHLGFEQVEESGIYAHYKTEEVRLMPDYCENHAAIREVFCSMTPAEYIDLQRLLAESVNALGLRFVLELPLEIIAANTAEVLGGSYND
jgi:hypothetical protein